MAFPFASKIEVERNTRCTLWACSNETIPLSTLTPISTTAQPTPEQADVTGVILEATFGTGAALCALILVYLAYRILRSRRERYAPIREGAEEAIELCGFPFGCQWNPIIKRSEGEADVEDGAAAEPNRETVADAPNREMVAVEIHGEPRANAGPVGNAGPVVNMAPNGAETIDQILNPKFWDVPIG